MSTIAVIPARGGSKRVPGKNIRAFCGKPMIAWSIEAALASKLFDRVIVSTDDQAIASTARTFGAEVPFDRPAELSGDHAGTLEVIAHAVRWMTAAGSVPATVCCVYATAPFMEIEDLRAGAAAMESGKWSYAFAVTDYPAPVYRAFREHAEGGLEMLFPEFYQTRSQDLPTALHDAGQFYWGRADAWLTGQRVFDRHSCPIRIPRWRVHDIDTEDDWRRAELVFTALRRDR